MEGYLSIKETAEKWGVSERRINQYCTEGRIPRAQKFGKSWAIPESAEKPDDPRKKRERTEKKVKEKAERRPWEHSNLMPLMNTAFAPGQVKEAVEAMNKGIQRDIAWSEYYYFSGHPEEAAREVEPYLTSSDRGGAPFGLSDLCLFKSFSGKYTKSESCFK